MTKFTIDNIMEYTSSKPIEIVSILNSLMVMIPTMSAFINIKYIPTPKINDSIDISKCLVWKSIESGNSILNLKSTYEEKYDSDSDICTEIDYD